MKIKIIPIILIAFIIAKLFEFINWSWWFIILAPFLIAGSIWLLSMLSILVPILTVVLTVIYSAKGKEK